MIARTACVLHELCTIALRRNMDLIGQAQESMAISLSLFSNMLDISVATSTSSQQSTMKEVAAILCETVGAYRMGEWIGEENEKTILSLLESIWTILERVD